jgi:anti-sigma factor RsiW
MSTCNTELLHDYAFDELPAAERPGFERHLAECASCAAELDQLRLTTAALRVLPDREPPQRIAFVSDKVFAPSRFWNFSPWLGLASTGVMAVALIMSAYHRPAEIRTVVVKQLPQPVDYEIVKKAVAQAQVEDARIFKAALAASELKHEQEHRTLMDAMYVLQAHEHNYIHDAEGNGQ